MRKLFSLLGIYIVVLLLVPFGLAQVPTGTIKGTVLDQAGAAVPDATVVIVNNRTNDTKTLHTDNSGRYTLQLVNPSVYTVTVTAPGFGSVRQDNVVVQVSMGRPVDFTLKPGKTSQQVKVSSTTPPLETTTSSMDTVITGNEILDLPLNGRNPFELETLAPGVSNIGGASTPHISGSPNGNNEQEIDGMTNILPENNVGNNSTAYQPIVDSMQEFSVQTSVPSAQYGRFSGGVINFITRTGTNQLHGDLFEFTQNSALYAKNYFQQGPNPAQHQNQFGGTLGGPIVIPHIYNGKDKSFFFVAIEDSRASQNQSELDSVPLDSWRKGVFNGASPVIYDPNTAFATANGYSRNPFTNNTIPVTRLSPVGLAAMKYYPEPNTGGTGATFNNYTVTAPTTNDYYHFDIKLDTSWRPNWHSFVRFSHLANTNVPLSDYNSAASQGYGGPSNSTAYSFVYDNAFTISPSLVADIHYGFSRATYVRLPFDAPFNLTSLGFPASYAAIAARTIEIFPNFSIGNGYSSLGSAGYVSLLENPSAHDVTGYLIKTLHGNSITMGGEFRKLFLNFHQYGEPSGQFGISQTWTQQNLNNFNGTGNPFASMLLGLGDYGFITHDISVSTASAYVAAYVQDDYQASPKLTFNLGLRWDAEIPRTERYNKLSYWDSSLPSPLQGQISPSACLYCGSLKGQMIFTGTPQSKYGRRQGPTQWLDFAPRLGFAWSATPKTVIRGGYGLVYAPSEMQAAGTSGAAGTDGFTSQTPFNFTFNNQQTIATTIDNPAPTGYDLPQGAAGGPSTFQGLGISDTFFSSYRNPYGIEGNLNVQRALPGKIVLEVGYVYNHGLFLINGDPGIPYSQVNPKYESLGNALFNTVPNPFYGKITTPGSPLSQPTIQRNYLLRPYPQYNGVESYRKATAGSHYNALIMQLEKRMSNGLYLLVAFTGSKTMDNAAGAVSYLGPTSQTYANQYNPKAEFGLSAYDVSRMLVTSYLYELPIGRGHRILGNLNTFANGLVTGWQTNGIVTWDTGTPIVLAAANDQTGLFTLGQRPNEAPGDANIKHKTLNHWFNTSLFSQPAPFTIGNAPRTLPNARVPGVVNTDLSAFKNTYVGSNGQYNIQLRLEAFNALNHPLFNGPNTNVNAGAQFGVINSQANSSRQVQLAAKFIF